MWAAQRTRPGEKPGKGWIFSAPFLWYAHGEVNGMNPLIKINKTLRALGIFGKLNMNGNRIQNAADPVDDQDAATKAWVERRIKEMMNGGGKA